VLDNHLNAVVIFMELQVYDVLNHQISFDKLELFAVRGGLKSWFNSHLVNRIQFVEIAKFGSNNTLHRYSSLYRETTYELPRVQY